MKMAIFAGNLGFKIAFELQYRVFSIPRVTKNGAILCLDGRGYSSSVPVRYIPNKSLNPKKLENSPPVKGLEKSEFRDRLDSSALGIDAQLVGEGVGRGRDLHQNRVRLPNLLFDGSEQVLEGEIDHDFGVIDHELMEEPEEEVEEINIHKGKDVCEHDVLRASKSTQAAEKLAIELLATRAFTAVELRKKLLGKRFPPDIVEAVINGLQSRGFINDSLYAETFSRSRWSSLSWGPRRIKQALYKKGISEVDAENAVKLVFKNGESDGDQESKHGMSKLSMDHLFVQASKQWLRGRDVPKEARKSRIVRWLQYRGFNWGVIGIILKKLESQYPP